MKEIHRGIRDRQMGSVFTRREALGLIAVGATAVNCGGAYREGCDLFKPIHLTALATVSPSGTSGTNSVALKNPYGALPMEILEVKWTLTNADGSSNLRSDNPVLNAGSVGCQLDLGSIPLTNGAVPIFGYGRSINEFIEAGDTPAVNFRWKPDHPLFVPPQAAISAKFQGTSLFKASVDTRISYSARSFPSQYKPKKVNVPYLMNYTSKPMSLAAADTDQSTETDILNIFPYPLRIYRIMGRINNLINIPPNYNNENASGTAGGVPAVANLIRLTMVNSKGQPLIRDLTPVGAAFNQQNRVWETYPGKTILEPGEHINVLIDKLASPSSSVSAVQCVTFISVLAYGQIDG